MSTIFKFLKDCEPLELVRVKLDEMSALAIVAASEGVSRRAFVMLSLDPPKYIHFMHDGRIDGDFERYKMLSYGRGYKVEPVHASFMQIGDGPLFKKAGSFVLAETESFLAVSVHPQHVRYMSLKTGAFHGEVGGARAAFPKWAIVLDGQDTPLFSFG